MRRFFKPLAAVLGAFAVFAAIAWAANEIHYNRSIVFLDSVSVKFGTGLDADLRWDGTDLDLLAAADDQVLKLGDGTSSWDVWFYGDAAADYALWDASASALSFVGAAYIRPNYNVTAKTSDYTVTSAEYDQVFTTRAAGGAVIFTLPAPASGNSGRWVRFLNVADQNMTVTTTAGSELVVFNNATASSVALSTSSEKIGGGFDAFSDGTSWIVSPLGEETQTVTVVD